MKRLVILAAALAAVLLPSYAAFATSPKSAVTAAPADRLSSAGVDAFWARAIQETYKSPEELKAQHEREVRKGIRYLKLIRGSSRASEIALTFDDGPHPDYTPKILDILRRYNVKATFFVVGKLAEQHPDLVRSELADGHVLGNHTYHHVNLTKIPVNDIAAEWQACEDIVKQETGVTMRYGRPPGGDYDGDVIDTAAGLGLTTVLWTDDPGDYASPGDNVIKSRVLRRVENGGIILLHDGVQQTIDVLPQIIETLHARGLRFVTIPELSGEASVSRR